MQIIDCEQYSEEWWAARRGLPTASEFSKIVTATGKLSTQSRQYICQLIAEEYTKEDENTFQTSEWMERGKALEQEARDWLTWDQGIQIEQVGLILNDAGTLGASPDGLIEDINPGGEVTIPIEIKCPKGSTHINYILKRQLPDTYRAQVHGQMVVTGAESAWFLSYHPDIAPLLLRVKRDEYTAKLDSALRQFVRDLAQARTKLEGRL